MALGRPARRGGERGLSLLESLLVVSLIVTVTASAVPMVLAGLDDQQALAAARHLAHRCALARFEAVKRSANVALRFGQKGQDYSYATYVDGNGNGVRTADIQRDIDFMLLPPEAIGHKFPGVRLGIAATVPGIDGGSALEAGSDPVRVGSSRMLSFSATGSATAGTVYLHSRRGQQYAVRVLGITGRTRVMEYRPESRKWRAR